MRSEEPPPLWLQSIPDREPWRRGRILVVCIALFYALVSLLGFVAVVLTGAIESAISLAIVMVLWWLMFSFVWFGTHWVRWLIGSYCLLTGFAQFIWAFRDERGALFLTAGVNLIVGALFFAPSVHFFAVRQKSEIRWTERLVVVGVFGVILLSFFTALFGVSLHRAAVQREADQYGRQAMQRIFADNDTAFLLAEASEDWRQARGDLGISHSLTHKYMRLGDVTNIRSTDSVLRSYFRLPFTINFEGVLEGHGEAACGEVRLRLVLIRSAAGWRIKGYRWLCPDG